LRSTPVRRAISRCGVSVPSRVWTVMRRCCFKTFTPVPPHSRGLRLMARLQRSAQQARLSMLRWGNLGWPPGQGLRRVEAGGNGLQPAAYGEARLRGLRFLLGPVAAPPKTRSLPKKPQSDVLLAWTLPQKFAYDDRTVSNSHGFSSQYAFSNIAKRSLY
jgi:hypothetical protein